MHNNGVSEELTLDVGCVQGSVLGPVLYLSDIPKILKDAKIFACADDSHPCIEAKNPPEAMKKAEKII